MESCGISTLLALESLELNTLKESTVDFLLSPLSFKDDERAFIRETNIKQELRPKVLRFVRIYGEGLNSLITQREFFVANYRELLLFKKVILGIYSLFSESEIPLCMMNFVNTFSLQQKHHLSYIQEEKALKVQAFKNLQMRDFNALCSVCFVVCIIPENTLFRVFTSVPFFVKNESWMVCVEHPMTPVLKNLETGAIVQIVHKDTEFAGNARLTQIN